jgi:D-glutamate cyclase
MKRLLEQGDLDWVRLEAAVRRDPARRGLASYADANGATLLAGDLQRAARDLAESGTRVLIVTGFCVVMPEGVTAETDGPPGAIFLAAMLRAVDIDARIATDRYGAPLVRAGLDAAVMPSDVLVEGGTDSYSHRIAIERVGPSHTAASIAAQYPDKADMLAKFERLVPQAERDVCHNMRGISIDAHTDPLHRLFENDAPTKTIGIVDGGNEIGCGRIPWDVLGRAVAHGSGAIIACRVATTHTIIAGVSNWGAYALGSAVASLLGGRQPIESWTAAKQRAMIEAMVARGGAVDGLTKRHEPTVDGLTLDDYLAVFDEIRTIALAAI